MRLDSKQVRRKLTTSGVWTAIVTLVWTLIVPMAALGAPLPPVPSAGCGTAGLAAGGHEFSVTHDSIARTYGVYVPAIHDNNVPAPVLLNLHPFVIGGPLLGTLFSTFSQQSVKADVEGFLIIEPDGTSTAAGPDFSWNAGLECCNPPVDQGIDDVGYILSVLDGLLDTLCIDERRVYAAGMSNGADMSHRLACEVPDRIAAIGPVVGSFSAELVCQDGGGKPVLQISGSNDNLVGRQASVDRWVLQNNCGPETTVTVENDTTCTTHTNCDDGVMVRHCVVDPGEHCFFSNAEIQPQCPVRAGGPLAQDMIWDFVSDYALVNVPEPSSHWVLIGGSLVLAVLHRRRGRASRSHRG
jgi:polyhydroxybutyrate depolymerase